ncbi:MAG: hypothetical protein QM654_03330 [Dysgonamonadaceae bacterium]
MQNSIDKEKCFLPEITTENTTDHHPCNATRKEASAGGKTTESVEQAIEGMVEKNIIKT